MNKVSKSVLKARMFEFFDRVEESGEPLIVTDFNVPVLKIVSLQARHAVDDVFASWRSKCRLDDKAVMSSTEGEWPES